MAAFEHPPNAVAASLEAQQLCLREAWPDGAEVRVRIALHTGEAPTQEQGLAGPSIAQAERLQALARGGQVLISATTAALLSDRLPEEASLVPLGTHGLWGARQPERVFHLAHPSLPTAFRPLRSRDLAPNNLPCQLTSFVGREGELAELHSLVTTRRLVTLVGPGGCGKTRLAAQLAGELTDAYPEGVWWVELAPLASLDLVPHAVMNALGLGDTRGLDPNERLQECIGEHDVLLVFDNCEHVVGSVAGLLDGLLRACPHLAAVATSREPLGVAGEVVWRVPSLSLPPEDTTRSAEEALVSEAVRLFVERALDARPDFRLDETNAADVAAICARLDGMPLAIELAAARVASLSPAAILEGLAHRLGLLTGGARAALARHQTLEASVAWSYELLSDAQQALARRLGAFSGSFGLKAVEVVCAGEPIREVLPLLSNLVDRSLVVFDGNRYRLLETIHEFLAARLSAAGEAASVRDGHLAYFAALAETSAAEIETSPSAAVLASLEDDHDNLRAALHWATTTGDHERALGLVVALTLFWEIHGHYSEAQSWYRRALAEAPATPSPLRARALWPLSNLSLYGLEADSGLGTYEREEAIALARELGDLPVLGRALADQGLLELLLAPDLAAATLQEAIEVARRSGDDWGLATALLWQAFFCVVIRDRNDLATPVLQELGDMARRSKSPYWLGWRDVCAAVAALRSGRLDEAWKQLEAALTIAEEIRDPMLETWGVGLLAEVPISLGDYEGAQSLIGRSAERLSRSAMGRQQWMEFGLAIVALARGDVAEAHRLLDTVDHVVHGLGVPMLVAKYDLVRGRLALEERDPAGATAAVEDALEIAARLELPSVQVEANNLQGRLARLRDDSAVAEDHHRQALALCAQHGFRVGAADTLEALAGLAALGESHAEATRLLGAAQALRDATGAQRWPLDLEGYGRLVAQLRGHLGHEAFEGSWSEGMSLSLDAALAYASRARGERKRPSSGWGSLTPTELEVVSLAAQGLTNAQIGRRLFIASGTAKIHLSHIFTKLGITNRAQLASLATSRGVGRPSPD